VSVNGAGKAKARITAADLRPYWQKRTRTYCDLHRRVPRALQFAKRLRGGERGTCLGLGVGAGGALGCERGALVAGLGTRAGCAAGIPLVTPLHARPALMQQQQQLAVTVCSLRTARRLRQKQSLCSVLLRATRIDPPPTMGPAAAQAPSLG
jgi:hypothetical protein